MAKMITCHSSHSVILFATIQFSCPTVVTMEESLEESVVVIPIVDGFLLLLVFLRYLVQSLQNLVLALLTSTSMSS